MSVRARAALLLAVALVASVLTLTAGTPAASAGSSTSWSRTRTLTREFAGPAGNRVVDKREVTVKVDQVTQLQGRERVRVSWSGAHPSAGRASSPYGEAGIFQEYPVVVMQCRGIDDPSLPKAKQVSPETCWTSTRVQRSQLQPSANAAWARDLFASDVDRQVKSGVSPYPAQKCNDNDPSLYAHVTPFMSAKGTEYTSCTSDTMGPEAAVGASFPAADQAAFTQTDGTGSTMFEVRSTVENESLGCSEKTACSIVVVPIMGLSCMAFDPTKIQQDSACRKSGQMRPGSSNFQNKDIDLSVSPQLWWSASNWRNRFSVPITFGLPPGVCEVLDSRAPSPFYGSELLSQAALQWAPAYCLRKDRFKWQQNSMPDEAAFALMQQGGAVAAEVSGRRESEGGDPVGYAPTAVTGFAVSYVIDKPDNAGEYTSLRLNARLLAKLLTESYPASSLGQGHPGIGGNPISMNQDPEFKRLNPGLSTTDSEAAATVMSLSTSSDVISTLTSYIAADPEAMAFVDGKADQDGMVVNPSYKGLKLPVAQWPLEDTFVPTSNMDCRKANPAPYLPQVAAPVGSMRTIASAVLDGWPLVATRCEQGTASDPWKLGRIDRQGVGSRFLLGITTLPDARRFGLTTAAMQTRPGTFVAPDTSSLSAAVALAKAGKALEPFSIKQADVRRDASAYPGTMVVYTAARTHGMAAGDAAKVATFIDVSSTEGQVPGRGNGQLPEGYLPIRASGATAKLFAAARAVAKAVRAQKAPRTAGTKGSKGSGGAATSGGGGAPLSTSSGAGGGSLGAGAAVGAPGAAAGAAAAGAATGPAATGAPTATVRPVATTPTSSGLAGLLLPGLLGLAVAGGLLGAISRGFLRMRGVR